MSPALMNRSRPMKIASTIPVPPRRPNQGVARSTSMRRPVLSLLLAPGAEAIDRSQAVPLAAAFQLDVTPRLAMPPYEVVVCAVRLQAALDLAAWRLGSAQSEGCVRIPATLNEFLDRHGVLDEEYERAVASGSRLWVLRKDRTPVASAGRYLVVVDSKRDERPAWSPLPAKR